MDRFKSGKQAIILKCMTVSGESGEVSVSTTEIMETYDENYIFKMDETLAAFGKHCLKRALLRKVKYAREGSGENCD